jgi:hypothetical protein
MEKKENSFIQLVCPVLGKVQDFTIEHALRLLKMPKNGGWYIPLDSKYYIDVNGAIRIKQDSGNIKAAKPKKRNSESNSTTK